jgi:hypothetical protein
MGATHLLAEQPDALLTASDIGRHIGLNGQKVNEFLEQKGLVVSFRDHKGRKRDDQESKCLTQKRSARRTGDVVPDLSECMSRPPRPSPDQVEQDLMAQVPHDAWTAFSNALIAAGTMPTPQRHQRGAGWKR